MRICKYVIFKYLNIRFNMYDPGELTYQVKKIHKVGSNGL